MRASARAISKTPHVPMRAATASALELSALRSEARTILELLMLERSAADLQALIELLESRKKLTTE